MVPGSKPGMNGAAGFQKGLSCESCHSKLKKKRKIVYRKIDNNKFSKLDPNINRCDLVFFFSPPDPAVQSSQWYAWGPPNMQCRLCASCWNYWKKYGGLKTPTHLDGTARASSVSRALLPPHLGPDSEKLQIKCFTKNSIYHLGVQPISCRLLPKNAPFHGCVWLFHISNNHNGFVSVCSY